MELILEGLEFGPFCNLARRSSVSRCCGDPIRAAVSIFMIGLSVWSKSDDVPHIHRLHQQALTHYNWLASTITCWCRSCRAGRLYFGCWSGSCCGQVAFKRLVCSHCGLWFDALEFDEYGPLVKNEDVKWRPLRVRCCLYTSTYVHTVTTSFNLRVTTNPIRLTLLQILAQTDDDVN